MPKRIITIQRERSWNEFEKALRSVHLAGDPSVTPYRNARISSRVVGVADVFPISRYLLPSHIQIQKDIRELLLAQHRIDTLDLNHNRPGVVFTDTWETGEWHLSPPVVEVSEADGGKPLLIDGEHRFMLAKQLGKPIRVIWIEDIPETIPVVALPIAWNDIELTDRVPDLESKRRFRFPTLASFPDISAFSSVAVRENNYRYFFYRDLSPICTSGIRSEGSR